MFSTGRNRSASVPANFDAGGSNGPTPFGCACQRRAAADHGRAELAGGSEVSGRCVASLADARAGYYPGCFGSRSPPYAAMEFFRRLHHPGFGHEYRLWVHDGHDRTHHRCSVGAEHDPILAKDRDQIVSHPVAARSSRPARSRGAPRPSASRKSGAVCRSRRAGARTQVAPRRSGPCWEGDRSRRGDSAPDR